MTDDEDPIVWAIRTRRRNALRVLAVGASILVVGAIWLANSVGFEPTQRFATDNTGQQEIVVRHKLDPRLLSGVLTAVGGLLALAGVGMLLRVRPPRE